MAGESCDDSCTGSSHTGRKVWSSFAILELIGHFYCVTVIKHSMSLKKNEKLHTNLKIRVICERDLQKVLKWNEEKELSYEIKDYVEFLKWNE